MNAISFRRRDLLAAATVAALAALSAGVAGYAQHQSGKQGQAAPQAMPVSVATVVQADVATWDEFSGRLEAVDRVDVRSRVAGAVQQIHFREGALVKRGDLLVTIDPAPYAAEAERAQAQVVAAQARLTYAKSEYERARRLWEERAIAQRELDSRANARDEADANLAAALAARQSAQLNLSYTQVRAPVAGRVGKLEVTVGNLVAAGPGAPTLTSLVSVSPIYAAFDAGSFTAGRSSLTATASFSVCRATSTRWRWWVKTITCVFLASSASTRSTAASRSWSNATRMSSTINGIGPHVATNRSTLANCRARKS